MIYLYSTSSGNARVEVIDKGFHQNCVLKANSVTAVELGPGNGQAFSKPTSGGIPPEQVYPGAAIHVRSTVPIGIVAATRFAYSSDTFTPLPIEALGRRYVCSSFADMSWMYGGYSLPSEVAIVAAYDNTRVSFTLGGPSVTRTGGGMTPGQTKTFSMNKGDVWIVGNEANSKEGDMTGSVIQSSLPVAVIAGNQCANVPTPLPWCDYITEQMTPIESWGRHLLVPRYISRTFGYIMRVFASKASTTVLRNGQQLTQLLTVGGSDPTGFYSGRATIDSTSTSLSASVPISATVYNTGQSDDNVSTDPFEMVVLPWEQFSTQYIFATPGTKGGINFTRNFMGIIFPVDDNGEVPSDLEFGTLSQSGVSWQPLRTKYGATFPSRDLYTDIMPDGRRYAYKECSLTSDGIYMLRCPRPIMVYSYGGSDYDSYGHPAGVMSMDLSKSEDKHVPKVQFTMLRDTIKGACVDYPDDATIRSNMAKVVLLDSSYNCSFNADPLRSDTMRTLTWTVSITDPSIDAQAQLAYTDRAGNDSVITIRYRASDWAKPSISASNPKDVCIGDTVVFSVLKDSLYSAFFWSTGDTGRSCRYYCAKAGLNFVSVKVKIGSAFVASDSVFFIVHTPPDRPEIVQRDSVFSTPKLFNATYRWYIDGLPVSGVTGDTLIVDVSKATTVVVELFDTFGCSSYSHPIFVSHTAVEDPGPGAESFQVQPNPGSARINVEFGDLHPTELRVYSAEGRLQQRFTAQDCAGSSVFIECASWAPGRYTLQIRVGDTYYRRSFIKY